MMGKRIVVGKRIVASLAGLAAGLFALSVGAQVKIGVIASSTGAIPFVGIPQKNAVALLPKKMGDFDVEYLVFDDASDPTQTVQLTKKLLVENKIDALIRYDLASTIPVVEEGAPPQ